MKVDDVLANEMVKLGSPPWLPEVIELHARPLTPVLEASHITDWSIEPDIEILIGRIGNLEPEIGSITANVPRL